MTTSTIEIPSTETPEIDSLLARRQDIEAELAAQGDALTLLRAKADRDPQARAEFATALSRSQELSAEQRQIDNSIWIARQSASSDAAQRLRQSKGYRGIVAEAHRTWLDRLAPWMPLRDAQAAAAQVGITVEGLPPHIAQEFTALDFWEGQMRRAGLLS